MVPNESNKITAANIQKSKGFVFLFLILFLQPCTVYILIICKKYVINSHYQNKSEPITISDAIASNTVAMINTATTLVSFQPFSSKWW